MFIEIFTNGDVLIDGQKSGKSYRAEEILHNYLLNPDGFRLPTASIAKTLPSRKNQRG